MIDFFDGAFEPSAFGRLENLILLDTIDSTNRLARGLIEHAAEEEVEVHPCAIAALTQTAGRGRRDRPWRSPRGGLYSSFLFRVPAGWRLSLLPLSASLWVSEALREAFGLSVSMKWPNDVLCGGRKIAGVLTEVRTRGEETHAAIGIGVNVFGAAEKFGRGATTAEEEKARRPSLSRLFAALCLQVAIFLENPILDSVVERWTARAAHRSGDILTLRIEEPAGEKRVSGRFAGLNPDGFLRLESPAGERMICSGEIEQW